MHQRLAAILAALTFAGGPIAAWAACEDPQVKCGAIVEPGCLDARYGAGAISSDQSKNSARCEAQFERYRTCLTDIARTCEGGAPSQADGADCTPDLEKRLWETVSASNDPGELSIFVQTCPQSPFALIAKRRIAAAGATQPQTPAAQPPAGAAADALVISPADRRAAQRELRRLRLYRGGIDGAWGPGSQSALRAFQRQKGLTPDGVLSRETLAALRAAPTPAAPAQSAPAASGFVGRYVGTWRDARNGFSGRSEFVALSYDPASGALRGRMTIEYRGVISRGIMTGRLTLQRGGVLSGQLRSSDGGGWSTTLRYQPARDFNEISGTFSSRPLPGAFGVAISGPFTSRRVE